MVATSEYDRHGAGRHGTPGRARVSSRWCDWRPAGWQAGQIILDDSPRMLAAALLLADDAQLRDLLCEYPPPAGIATSEALSAWLASIPGPDQADAARITARQIARAEAWRAQSPPGLSGLTGGPGGSSTRAGGRGRAVAGGLVLAAVTVAAGVILRGL